MLFEVLHKERASLASLLTARADLGEGPLLLAELVWGDSTPTRECKFSCMCKLLPTSWHLLTNVCLKVVSDVSVPLLLFVFRFNPHFPLSAQHPECFQTPTGKHGCYILCNFPSFLFLEGKQCNFLKGTFHLFMGPVLYLLFKGR